MSECAGQGCTHPDHQSVPYAAGARPLLDRLQGSVAPEKLAVMNRAERRKLARALGRTGTPPQPLTW